MASPKLPFTILVIVIGLVSLSLVACSDDDDSSSPNADITDAGSDATSDTDELSGSDTPTSDGQADTTSDQIICRPCTISSDCGGTNECITLPSGEQVCGVDCSVNPDICPEETFCALLNEDDSLSQCVPESLYCVNQCGEPPEACENAAEVCDPLTGECGPPRGLCDECIINEHCGEGNFCLAFPDEDNYRGCGRACGAPEDCPEEGYVCATVNDAGDQQCIPEILTCIDRCTGVTCGDDEYCNPLNGDCEIPGAVCEECFSNAQCGGEFDLCLTYPDGNTHCSQDCSETAVDNPPDQGVGLCPPGYVCYELGLTVSQCVPTLMTCIDHCEEPEPVDCGPDGNCDPVTGECHPVQVGLCGQPCVENYDCGEQEDLCLSMTGLSTDVFCSAACDADNGVVCPIGYSCYALTDNLRQQCGPSGFDAVCGDCTSTVCPDGEFCRPIDGECYPAPTPCTDTTDCPDDELCNSNWGAQYCEPLGLPCRYNEYYDCGSETVCSATSTGMEWGECLQDCTWVDDACPDTAPACEEIDGRYHFACVERGLGGPERCGRLTDADVGRPCPYSDENDYCPLGTDICLTALAPEIPGFCTLECASEEVTCPTGSHCAEVPTTGTQYCVPDICSCIISPNLEVGEADVLQTALDAYELTRCDLAYYAAERNTAGMAVVNDPFRIARVGTVRNEILSGASMAGEWATELSDGITLSKAIQLAATELGVGRALFVESFVEDSFCDVIRTVFTMADEATPPECDTLTDEEAAIPTAILQDVITAIEVINWAANTRGAYLPAEMTSEAFDAVVASLHRQLLPGTSDVPDAYENRDLLLGFDYETIFTIAATLADELEGLAFNPDGGDVTTAVTITTPRGLIIVRDTTDGVYCIGADDCPDDVVGTAETFTEHVLFFLDLGGNDTYYGPVASTSTFEDGVSVFIDMAGNDLYRYKETDVATGDLLPPDIGGRGTTTAYSLSTIGRQASARGGIAFLYDHGQGADTYTSLRMSQGYGSLGVGALVDDGCSAADCIDIFESEALSQGAGLYGIGILLLDGAGNDEITGFSHVQGVGGPMGVGMVINLEGDSRYEAFNGATVESRLYAGPDQISPGYWYPPISSNQYNWSASQGAGVGYFHYPAIGGQNVSGGIGLLFDLGGIDTYSAGLTAQGAGYFHGLGLLLDSEGDDHYQTAGFGQGAGLDFGVGLLIEQAGADTYNSADLRPLFSLGLGSNFGAGLLLEEGGGDSYFSGSKTLGFGNFNGTGVFLENAGEDTYDSSSQDSFGAALLTVDGDRPATNPRRDARTVGIFVDADGTSDNYTRPDLDDPYIGNSTVDGAMLWLQTTGGVEGLLEYGVGVDWNGSTGVTTLVE